MAYRDIQQKCSHKFQLPEEETLKAVLRTTAPILSTDEVRRNFREVRLDVISGARMRKKINGTRIGKSLILVQPAMTAQNRKIFKLTQLGHMLIK